MNIPMTINDKKVVFEVQSDETLMNVLHNETSTHIKCGCQQGFCGSCTVLLNGEPVAACKIPVGIVRNAKIETLDYFEKSEYYSYINQGFSKAGIHLCGFCDAGKIFSAYTILKNNTNKKITREEIIEQVKNLAPCCTDLETLVNGIIFAIALQNKNSTKIRHSSRVKKWKQFYTQKQ